MSDAPPQPPALRQLDRARVLRALHALEAGHPAPWLHAEVGRRMAERLAVIRLQPAAWLDWWARVGAAGGEVAQAYPQAQHGVVEPTETLRQQSRLAPRAPWWSLRRKQSPVVMGPDEVAPASVQLVWANMMLHAAMDPPSLMSRWHAALAVDGFVMFSCLGPGTLLALQALYRRMGWGSPMAELVDMHDLGDMLVQAGFADPVMDQETLTLSWADPAAALAELRGLGGNAAPNRYAGLRTKRWREHLLQELNALRGADGRVHLHFEVVYGHAFKPVPRARMTGETAISVADMRAMVRKRDTRF
jgi:malonyl-CoA O-methyltransferase